MDIAHDLVRRDCPPPDLSERQHAFLDEVRPETPCLVVDLDRVEAQYRALRENLPPARILYAVKANPHAEVVSRLMSLGAGFDLASPGELDRCLGVGVPPTRLSFGHTIKKARDIAHFHHAGIDLFAVDCLAELEKVAQAAPGARVFCRLAVSGRGALWPLSRKFGCDEVTAVEILTRARGLGLKPYGVSFHVGSQQTDPRQWAAPISRAAKVFRAMARRGVDLEMLNLGGGLPGHYQAPVPSIELYAATIDAAVRRHFGGGMPHLMIEPGRFLVADAGVIESQVVLVAERLSARGNRWVFVDAGRFNGLFESTGERIRYHVQTPDRDGPTGPVVLAGPTCDSADVPYERAAYRLPLGLQVGDRVRFLNAGAYAASCAAVEFNGFDPIATYCL